MRHFFRFCALTAVFVFLITGVLAEPQVLSECTTRQEANLFVDYPIRMDDGQKAAPVTAGRIRYISQTNACEYFMKEHWLGGAEGSSLDLTRTTDAYGKNYEFFCGNMCTRAVFSMAMSYMGIDITPGGMSRLMSARNILQPYDSVIAALGGLERVENTSYKGLDVMVDHFLTDPAYSPVMITIKRDDNSTHSLLIIGRDSEDRFIVVDPAHHLLDGEALYVHLIRPGKSRWKILGATVKSYEGAIIRTCFQWKRVP